jgi:hypothetical protein
VKKKGRSCYVAQAGFELAILWPQPPKFWDDRYTPSLSAKKGLK